MLRHGNTSEASHLFACWAGLASSKRMRCLTVHAIQIFAAEHRCCTCVPNQRIRAGTSAWLAVPMTNDGAQSVAYDMQSVCAPPPQLTN